MGGIDRRSVARAGAYALLVAAPLATGTIHRTAVACAAIAAGLICLVALPASPGRNVRRLAPLYLLLGLAVALCIVQLLPLPHRVLFALQRVRADLSPILGGGPQPLTVDVPATLFSLTGLLAYGVFALAVQELAQAADRRRALLRAVAVAASIAAVASAVDVVNPTVLPVLTFINVNHAAACFTLGAGAALALGLSAEGSAGWPWLALAAFLVASVGLTGSRGGAAACAVAVAVVLLAVRRRDHRRPSRRKLAVGVLLIAGAAVVAGGAVYRKSSSRELAAMARDPAYKFHTWSACAPLALRAWPLGIGRGGFTVLSTTCNPASGSVTEPYLENEPLQAIVELGLPGGVVLIGLGLWLGLGTVRRAFGGHDPSTVAAAAGLVALALHNLVDFNLEAGGVAYLAIALVAAGAPLPEPSREGRRTTGRRRPRPSRWRMRMTGIALAGSAVAAGCLLLRPRFALAEEDDAAIARLARETPRDTGAVLEMGRDALARHPYDDFLYSTIGTVLATRDPRAAIDHLDRSLLLNPHSLGAHLATSLILLATGHRPQGLLELRSAILSTEPPAQLADVVAEVCKNVDEVRAATPPLPELWNAIAGVLAGRGRARDAVALLRQESLTFPADRAAVLSYARTAAAAGLADEARAAAQLVKQRYADPEALVATGLAEAAAGDTASALADLHRANRDAPADAAAAFALARFLASHGQASEAGTVLDRLESAAVLDTAQVVAMHQTRASVDRAAGREAAARREEQLAAEASQGQ